MDGTPYVTQCPILPGARFVYKFQARTTGTMFWHSHTSFQRGDGAFGPYIVRRTAENDPQTHLYDFDLTEHLIFPQEWFHEVSLSSIFLSISCTVTYFKTFRVQEKPSLNIIGK